MSEIIPSRLSLHFLTPEVPEVLLIVEGLRLLVPVDDFAGCGCDCNAVDLKLSCSLPSLLLQVHFL